jgi:hypothetical protein
MNNTTQSLQYQLIQLKKIVYSYFGNEKWMYIRHPKLNYVCPYRY